MSGNTNSGRIKKGQGLQPEAHSEIPSPPQQKETPIKIPAQLIGHAREYWIKIAQVLVDRGSYEESDFFALERLSIFYGEWKRIEKVILEKGMTYEAETDRGAYVIRERPEAKLMLNMNKEIKDFERKFGLTPLDRNGPVKSGGNQSHKPAIRERY